MILNPKQQTAKESIEHFLKSDKKEFLLTGRAGTGKTTTVKYVKYPYKVIGMAISHKAKEVLSASLELPCITVAAAIGLEKVDNLDTGETDFIPFGKEVVKDEIIFIVDECSMISSFEREKLLELYPNSKFIYLGDIYQLPPIKEMNCPIFIDDSIDNIELLENMRTGNESPIMTLLNKLVELQNNPNTTLQDIFKVLPKQDSIIDDKALLYRKPISSMVQEYHDTIIITYHVKQKEKLNNMYRTSILNTTEPYIVGDKLIFNNNIFVNEAKVFTNSQIVTVNSISKTKYKDQFSIYKLHNGKIEEEVLSIDEPFYIITVDESNFQLIVPANMDKFSTILNSIQKEAKKLNNYYKERRYMWKKYFSILQAYYDVSYAYAITSHKAQGSTYKNVTVDVNDILYSHMSIKDKLKCLYVACSRASHVLNISY